MGNLIEVRFKVEVPTEATQAQIKEWVSYNLNETASIKLDNPLCDEPMEAQWNSLDIEF